MTLEEANVIGIGGEFMACCSGQVDSDTPSDDTGGSYSHGKTP